MKEKILMGVIGIVIIATIMMLSSHLDKEFIKDCTSKGYSESYCLAKA